MKNFMWMLYALGSAVFAGITSILAKCGIKETDSNVATAIRTIVVLFFSWVMVFVVGSQKTLSSISAKSLVYLILSGIVTGASWLCYFKALQLGDVNKVVPVDKTSTVMTIVLSFLILGERVNWTKATGAAIIGVGTYLMIQKRNDIKTEAEGKTWLIYAFLSALFASLTAIFAKIGIENVESNLGTAIRTGVVLIVAWVVVFATGKGKQAVSVPKKELLFICLSGFATGASWLCYYRALQDGPASVVVPIDKLSILITVAFSRIVFGEKLTAKSGVGLFCITLGTVAMLF